MTAPQVETLLALVAHLRAAGLPQAPTVRAAMIPGVSRAEIADATVILVIPAMPNSRLGTRRTVEVQHVFEVGMQRAIPTGTDAPGAVQDLDWGSIVAMLELQRALMLALYAFRGVLLVEGVNAGPAEHIVQGTWTGIFRITVQGESEALA